MTNFRRNIIFSEFLHVIDRFIDPVTQAANSSKNSWFVCSCALSQLVDCLSIAETGCSIQCPVAIFKAGQWATRISLASADWTIEWSSASHCFVIERTSPNLVITAGFIILNWVSDLLKSVRSLVVGVGDTTPSSGDTTVFIFGQLSSIGQTNWSYVVVEFNWGFQFQHSNIGDVLGLVISVVQNFFWLQLWLLVVPWIDCHGYRSKAWICQHCGRIYPR